MNKDDQISIDITAKEASVQLAAVIAGATKCRAYCTPVSHV